MNILESSQYQNLKELYSNWDNILVQLEKSTREERSSILKKWLLHGRMIKSYSLTLPLLNVPSYEVHSLLYMGNPYAKVFLDIQIKLCQLYAGRLFYYSYHKRKDPITVFVWETDYPKLSKVMRQKLVRIEVE